MFGGGGGGYYAFRCGRRLHAARRTPRLEFHVTLTPINAHIKFIFDRAIHGDPEWNKPLDFGEHRKTKIGNGRWQPIGENMMKRLVHAIYM